MNEQSTADTTNVQTTEQIETTVVDQSTTQVDPGTQSQAADQTKPNDHTEIQTTQKAEIPESADAYSVSIHGFDFDAFKADNGEVLKAFHAEGMTNKQVEAVVKAYDQHTAVQVEALQQEWGDSFNTNVNFAKQAIEALGFQASDLDSPIGALKLAAAIGKQIQEDLPPQSTQQIGSETIEQLMMSDAYGDANHPDHKSVAERVSNHFKQKYPD